MEIFSDFEGSRFLCFEKKLNFGPKAHFEKKVVKFAEIAVFLKFKGRLCDNMIQLADSEDALVP